MSKVSVLILTKNEQLDLPGCLESIAWCDDIHIFDSMSTDNTIKIATSFDAKVTQRDYGTNKRAFGGDESAHRNWGLQNISYKYDWVLVVDADERVTPDLAMHVSNAIDSAGDFVAFSIQRRDFFMNTWLEHVQTSPFYVRLLKVGKVHYERLINPVVVPNGPTGSIKGFLDHYPFSKGINFWIERHNAYSNAEAAQIITNRQANHSFSINAAFFEKDFHIRRFNQKELFYRLPFRPIVKFLMLYVLKCGFLDGRAGFTYAALQSIYEYFIILKVREIEDQVNTERLQ